MQLETALQLAARYGTVEQVEKSPGYFVRVAKDRYVTFQVLPDGTVDDVWTWWQSSDGEMEGSGCRTLARGICHAKWRKHEFAFDGRAVVIEEKYEGAAVRRVLKVTVDGAEVVGGGKAFETLADGAIGAKCPAALLDWIEERAVARDKTLILL